MTLAHGVCIALEYTVTFCKVHTCHPNSLCANFAYIDSLYIIAICSSLPSVLHPCPREKDSASTVMRCLSCFQSKPVSRRSKDRCHDRKRQSRDVRLNSNHKSPPFLCAYSSQPTSRPDARILPQSRQHYETSNEQRSSSMCSELPEYLPIPSSVSRQYRTTNDSYGPTESLRSHRNRMTRLHVQDQRPHRRENSSFILGNRGPSRLAFNERMAQLTTQNPFIHERTTQQRTFLHDASTSSSEDDESSEPQSFNDSGYVSMLTTPAKPNIQPVNSAVESIIAPDLVPAPLFFNARMQARTTHNAEPDVPKVENNVVLCDHRQCLRHDETCLEHTPTPVQRSQASRVSAPKHQDEWDKRIARGRGSDRYEPDVWMQVASEYRPSL